MFSISIITATFNNALTITDCINSVQTQTQQPLEHIIIDAQSMDGTLQILQKFNHLKVISEPDKGLYDALNKGIRLAQGDIIGFLHADDFYASNQVLEWVVNTFKAYNCEAVYGDLQYVHPHNTNKVIRKWIAGPYQRSLLKNGWMPPHPALFIKKAIYKQYGMFDLSYSIAADYELMMRLLWKYNISIIYIPHVLIKMRIGGKSNRLSNIYLKMKEDYRVIKKYKLGGFTTLFLKNTVKLKQFL